MNMFANPPTEEIRQILNISKSIAVVGISNREYRASRYVSEYMKKSGYKIYPVNPLIAEWDGQKVYDSVLDIPDKIDIVNVFRRSNDVLPLAREVARSTANVMWLQQGVVNADAADIVYKVGIKVVMDSCIMIEHRSMVLDICSS